MDPSIDDILLAWQEADEQGQMISIADLCARRPDLADEVQRRIAVLKQFQRLKSCGDPTGVASQPAADADQLPIRMPHRKNAPDQAGDSSPASLDETSPDRSASIPPDSKIAPGTRLGDYELEARLGRGGMGEVYRARHVRLQRTVALKVIAPQWAADSHLLERFRREQVALAQIESPHVVAAYDAREAEGVHFLVMEYVPGIDLHQLLLRDGPLAESLAADYLLQALRGLSAAHERGIVHRDIKPSNLLLTTDGKVKVLDLGLARWCRPDGEEMETPKLTADESILGTVDFMAPEQALTPRDVDARADLYSIGCTLYFLLTGASMYPGGSAMARMMAHQTQPIPSLRDRRPDISPALERLYGELVAKSPGDRPASARAVIDRLAGLSTAEPSPTSERRSLWPSPTMPSGTAILAGSFLLLILGVIFQPWIPILGSREPNSTNDKAALEIVVRQGDELRSLAAALPIRTDDDLRIECLLPAHHEGSLFWLDTEGALHDLSPQRIAETDGRIRLVWPAPDRSRNIAGAPGTEVIFACARPDRVPTEAEVRIALGTTAPWPPLASGTLIELSQGEVRAQTDIDGRMVYRGPGNVERDWPGKSALNQADSFRLKLQATVPWIRGVAFPHVQR